MTVTAAGFRAKYTKWANFTDAQVQPWLDEAELANDETYFGDQYDRAVELYTAHLLMQEEMAAASRNGPLTSFSVDKESFSFGSSGTGLDGTVYGQRYQRLVTSCYTGGITTGTTGRY